MLLGVALQTAAQNLGYFIAARFLIGFGLTFSSEFVCVSNGPC